MRPCRSELDNLATDTEGMVEREASEGRVVEQHASVACHSAAFESAETMPTTSYA